ncbi:unnamed protein product [Rotaria sordida]|uniref:CNH domain-containing protein n=2 Tax=Rotaria sordida TaxID=392033 RepID=A0A813TQF0_9BILA|nr:unnamed protein product [Rotaria sordida]
MIHEMNEPIFCYLVHKFSLQKNSISSETKEFECHCTASVNLGTRKPIGKIKVVILSLHRVITLSDNLLQVLNSDNLQFISNIKLKNIITFAVSNQFKQGASIDMCVSTKRNKLQIYRLDRMNINLIYEISVHDPLISIGIDECGILACSKTAYFAYRPTMNNDRRSTGSLQTIFTLQDPSIVACFTFIKPGEYLLSGPNIGITTTLEGTSQRTPIMFISQPNDFIYSHPYLLVRVKDYIHIYSYLDDQLKQEIPLKNCQTLINIPEGNINNILINTKDNIYLLESLSIQEQIDQLLNTYRLQEALILAESNCSSIEKHNTNSLILSTKKRVGFIEFNSMNVIRALHLFDDINLDFHEIILQIPNFLPLNSPWPDFDENIKSRYILWLNAFCDYMTKRSEEFSRQSDYYSSLLKAYLIIKSRETIIEFLEKYASYIPIDFHNLLFHIRLYHGAAILYSAHGKHEQTIDIWKNVELNLDRSLEFSVGKWLLEQHEEELATKIFISKYQNESNRDPFNSNKVTHLLKPYPTALRNYLEQGVFKLMIETDEIHTMLVNIYLDQILSKSSDDNEQTRTKLQEFLVKSNFYRVQSVLNRINQTKRFKRELALLYGKMNNFEQTFQILVNELEDFQYAENYCVALSFDKSSDDRKIVAHALFNAFLASFDKHPNEITAALLHLLCNNEVEFDFIEILKRLPSQWSISSLKDILLRATRTYSYIKRSTKLEIALDRIQNEKLNIKLRKLKRSNVIINEYRRCKNCLKQFYETSCIVYQDGSQVHVHCAKQLN